MERKYSNQRGRGRGGYSSFRSEEADFQEMGRHDYYDNRDYQSRTYTSNRGGPPRPRKTNKMSTGQKTVPKHVDMSSLVPKHLTKEPTPPTDEPLWEDSVFSVQMSVAESRGRTHFYGDYSTLIPYGNDIYVMIASQQDIEKRITREMFSYYITVLLWARIVDLKSQRGQQLSQEERDYRDNLATLNPVVPLPIQQYLMAVGTVKRMGGNILYPEFPPLPVGTIAGNGGFFANAGMIPAEIASYISFPCLGVTSDALRAQTTQPFVGVYVSSVCPQAAPVVATSNLPGFGVASKPRPEALSSLVASGVTAAVFRQSIAKTGLNMDVVQRVSNTFCTLTAYKAVPMHFVGLASMGSPAQVIIQLRQDPAPGIFVDGQFIGQASEGYTTTEYGVSAAFAFMCPRVDAPVGGYLAWSPIDFGINPVPARWNVAHANRRYAQNPPEIGINIWHGIELIAGARRKTIATQLSDLKTK